MLTLLDESGDPGLTPDSSPLFSVTVVHFANPDEANACQSSLTLLRTQLSLSPHKEFHFAKDNPKIIRAALQVMAQHDFQYSSFVINKKAITDPAMRHKHSIYQFASRSALYPLRDHLRQTILIMDECGGATFTNEMGTYLRQATREWSTPDSPCIKKTRTVRSKSHQLIQVADYISGAVFRSFSTRPDPSQYRDLIRHREAFVEIWPPSA